MLSLHRNAGLAVVGAVAAYQLARLVHFLLRGDCDFALAGKRLRPQFIEGRVFWITGASSGIGEELVKRVVGLGGLVVASARRGAELQRVRASCSDPSKVVCLELDLTQNATHADKTSSALELAGAAWGEDKRRIDVLVNNGGRSQRCLVEETLDDASIERAMLEVNYLGLVTLTKQVLKKAMLPNRAGLIVNISSVAGKVGAPVSAGYSGAKHAVQGWANTLRDEVAEHGISVLTVCPGPVATAIASNALAKDGSTFSTPANADAGKMPVGRCVDLLLVAMTNNVNEAWISPQPVLVAVYISIFFSSFSWLLRRGIRARIKAYKSGHGLYGGGLGLSK